MYKLSNIMWLEAGRGSARRVMPFALKGDILCNLSDDRLFQHHPEKSMYDNLYELCQNEYHYSTVIINNPVRLDTTNPQQPKILQVDLPKLFMLMHKKEYLATKDISVNEAEIKRLAKYISKEKAKQLAAASRYERQ